jgi:hypothetical protein
MPKKDKTVNILFRHIKPVILGISLAVTFAVGTIVGMVDHQASAMINLGPPCRNPFAPCP